jgi:drug/metabolite transporter (DMT)-like permease
MVWQLPGAGLGISPGRCKVCLIFPLILDRSWKETDMNQTTQNPMKGALFMVLAGMAFALANSVTFTVVYKMGFKPQSDTFWQYGIALVFAVPFMWKNGLSSLRTAHPVLHILRVVLSALGILAFAKAFAAGLPTWHVVALVMVSPYFVMLGAMIFLKEKVTPNRWVAATIAFAGAMILLRPWESGLPLSMLYPVAAAALWAGASLITKRLTRDEPQTTITMWLLVLLTPIFAVLSLQAGFEVPSGTILLLLLAGGVIMFAAQHFLTLSYANADAAFVQPFDDLKLFSNILVSWVIFGDAPTGIYWLGIALILSGTGYLLWSERQRQTAAVAA